MRRWFLVRLLATCGLLLLFAAVYLTLIVRLARISRQEPARERPTCSDLSYLVPVRCEGSRLSCPAGTTMSFVRPAEDLLLVQCRCPSPDGGAGLR